MLTGERRAYLKTGKWTYLFPGTISARTYLKQADFAAYTELCYIAEPLNVIASFTCLPPPGDGGVTDRYLELGWRYLLSNHSHDANGGCAPDSVCRDMEYRYRKVQDIAEIVSEDAMAYIAKNLSPDGQAKDIVQLVIYNTLPYERSAIAELDIEVPAELGKGINIEGVKLQPIQSEKSSIFVDNIWDVPTILDSYHHRVYAKIDNIPAMGYKVIEIKGSPAKMQKRPGIAQNGVLENEYLRAKVNNDGTIDVLYKPTGKLYKGLNYFTSQGEAGNAWKHESPEFDRKYKSNLSQIYITESGELSGTIVCEGDFAVPESCAVNPSDIYVNVHIKTSYTLEKDAEYIRIRTEVNNTAKDHWLRANFPTGIKTEYSYSDSHFDIVRRDIAIPDSTGWVEQPFGTQPLRTFAAVTDNNDGFSIMPKGLFEYEVYGDSTMALTLIRACRIKLAVSEEKVTELEDEGIQCPGKQVFEYAMRFNKGDINELPNKAAELFTPVKCAVCGRGKGSLPREQSVLAIDNQSIHVTAVKRADDGDGIILRYYNPSDEPQTVDIKASGKMYLCSLDETVTEETASSHTAEAKKIVTVRIK